MRPGSAGVSGWRSRSTTVPTRAIGGFGWDGGLGTTWSVDPHRDLIAILLTNQAWSSPEPPALHRDFLRRAVGLTGDGGDRSE